VELLDAEVAPELIDDGQERDRPAERDALPLEPGRVLAAPGQRPTDLEEQARLADAGITRDEDDLAAPRLRLTEALTENVQLTLPPHQWRQPPLAGGVETRAPAPWPHDLVSVNRCAALHRLLAEVERLEEPADRPQRRFADQHAAGPGPLLHAGRDVRGVAHRGVVHPEVVPDATAHDRARVEPDPHPDRRTLAGLDLAAQIAHRALDSERRVDGATRAVLVGDGRAEERHDTVAGVLVDRALESVDFRRDRFEATIHDLMDVLGVPTLGEAPGPGAVREPT